MKRVLLTAFLLSSLTASAQFTNSRKANYSSFPKGWFDIYALYNNVNNDGYNDLDKSLQRWIPSSMNGFSLGFNKAFNISYSYPLYLLAGGAFEYDIVLAGHTITESSSQKQFDLKGTTFSFKLPVSITFQFNLNDILSLEPFVGLNARYYFLAKLKEDYEYKNEKYSVHKTDRDEWNFYRRDDTEGHPANHFVLGGQIGVTVGIAKHFTISAFFEQDFTKVHEYLDDKCYRFNAGIGYRF